MKREIHHLLEPHRRPRLMRASPEVKIHSLSIHWDDLIMFSFRPLIALYVIVACVRANRQGARILSAPRECAGTGLVLQAKVNPPIVIVHFKMAVRLVWPVPLRAQRSVRSTVTETLGQTKPDILAVRSVDPLSGPSPVDQLTSFF